MTCDLPRTRRRLTVCATVIYFLLSGRSAFADKTLAKDAEWEIFTDGRAGVFLSYLRGDAIPRAITDPTGNLIQGVQPGTGFDAFAERNTVPGSNPPQMSRAGTLETMRVRSGFIGNTVGLGVRGLNGGTTFTGYIQIWALIETAERQKGNIQNIGDVRQGFVKVEGRWGSVLGGRSRGLFSRGATDIDAMYAHRYGLGFPGRIDSNGPTAGHIGFGVLASGFGAGLVYATPVLSGLQLTVGVYDPVQLQGAWTRTKWVRPEAEVTFERPIGGLGKVVLFANGAYQNLYKVDSPDSTSAAGFGYGGRVEVGPARLGMAGHYGRGIGLNYALEASSAAIDLQSGLRTCDGYYVQSQVVLGRMELSAGWGIARVFLITPGPDDDPTLSVIKHQMGISTGIVYHVRPWLHLDLDGFRAEAAWFRGEKQVVYVANSGMTFTW